MANPDQSDINNDGFGDSCDVEITDLEKLMSQLNIQVYPVPASEKLYVDLGNGPNETATLRLTDMKGKALRIIELTTDLNRVVEIDVSDLPSGHYILNINLNEEHGNTVVQID